MPGRNTSTSPASSRSARRTAEPTAASRRSSRRPRQPADVDGERPPGALDDGRRHAVDRQQAGEQRGVGGRRHRQDAQVGAQRRRRVERERQAEVGRQVALVDLVEDHRGRRRAARDPAAGGGSARPRSAPRSGWRVRCAARRGSGSRRGRRRSCRSGRPSAGPRPASPGGAVRASTIRRPPSHGSSSRASGTTVVLPAPGGAATTARAVVGRGRRAARRGSRRSGGRGARGRAARGPAQPSAGEPWNGPGSPMSGMSGARPRRRRRRSRRRRPATPARVHPSAAATTVPSTRTNTNAGSSVRPSALTATRSGSVNTRNSLDERTEEGPGVALVGGDEEVDPDVGAAQALEDAGGGRQDPRALVGVRVEHHRGEVERRQPLLELAAPRHRAGPA